MFTRIFKLFFLLFLFIAFSNASKAVTFQNYSELYECIENHTTFFGYKKNLTKCFEKKGISIEKDSLKLIKNEYGIIDNIIDLNLPKEETIKIKKPKKKLSEVLKKAFDPDFKEIEKKENIFNKPSALSDEYKEKSFSLNDKDFKNLNNYIKRNPEDIYAITEDINILTYKNQYLSEFKREEILLNVYNSFDVAILASKVPPPGEAAAFGGAGGMVAVAAIAAAAGGGGSSGTGTPPTLSFAVSSTSVGECDSDVTVTANLTAAHSSNVTITYTVGGTATKDTDYAISSTTSTIVAGATSGSITVNPTNDTTAETSETVTLSASVSGVSTTGSTSATITIHDYVLKCNTTAYSEGTTSEQNTIKNRSQFANVDNSANSVHPYELMNVHKAQSFKSSGTALTGVGEVIHVADFNCDANHDLYLNKTVTNLDDGGSGESTFGAATAANHHCQFVASMAAGDIAGSDISGVAPDADLVLSSIPNTQGTYAADDYGRDLDSARTLSAVSSNNSWVLGDSTDGNANANLNVTEMQTFITSNSSSTTDQLFGFKLGGNAGLPTAQTTAWTDYVTAMDNFQASGVMVWANGNYDGESDASVMAGLPEFYSQLAEAWITVNLSDFTGSSLSGASESDFTLIGNKCGSAKEYCLTADGHQLKGASWVNSGTSQYSTGSGSSYSAPMIAGGIALIAQAFPNHTPEQVTDRLLASANNNWFTPSGNTTFTTHGASIKHGYHETWGHGVPDFYAALSPITSSSNPASFGFASSKSNSGSSGSVPFNGIAKMAVSQTILSPSSSLGDAILNGLTNKTTYAYDALNGGFKYNVNDFINYNSLTEQKIEHTLDQEFNNLRNFNVSKDIAKDAQDFNIYAGEYVNLRDKHNRGLSITLDQPNIALQNFNLYNNQNYKNPFTSENKGVGFNNKFYFFGNNILLGYNNSKFNPLTSVNENLVVPMETLALSVNLDSDNFDLLSFTTGLIKEKNTFLLSEGSGAFDLSDENNISNFYGFNLSKSLSDFSNIYLSTMFGNSKLNNANNSFIVDASDVLSSSFEINYELKNLINSDQLNISLSQPNRVEQGDMTFRFMGLADKNGILPYQDEKISLSPSGRQKDLTVSYYKNHSKNLKTGIKAVLTDDLGHVKNNNLDTNLLLSATFSF
ncbi:S8 family serine peptidase [Candidatus Pelagibacter sp.]|nr:S8 family serine peptidase [Candidatus Pelagibacter sp.]